MQALKTLTLALTVALVGAACSDDDSGGGASHLDGGIAHLDAGFDAAKGPTKITLPDGGALPCSANTLPANGKCGGSSCEQTEAQLAASATAGAKCGAPVEVAAFCSLSAVNTVTSCSYGAIGNLSSNNLDGFAADTKTCATPKVDATFSSGCLDCFVASARCTAANCLTECGASTASDACETCRITKRCIKEFYDCAGYADPLAPLYPLLP